MGLSPDTVCCAQRRKVELDSASATVTRNVAKVELDFVSATVTRNEMLWGCHTIQFVARNFAQK